MSSQKKKPTLRILCVDDEPDLLLILKDLFKPTGFEILTASSADDALQIIRQQGERIIFVISDYQMENKTGFDLRREMLTINKDIPFVLMSGHITREFALEAIDLKISGFIAKPFSHEELTASFTSHSKDRIAAINEDDELREGFIADAENLIAEMEGLVLRYESEPQNVELLNRIFACAHTIKGTSGFFRPDTIHRFTHKYEDFLSGFRKGERPFTSASSQVLLNGLDKLKMLVSALEKQVPHHEPIEELLKIFVETPSETPSAAAIERATKSEQLASAETKDQSDELKISVESLNEFLEQSGELTVLRNMVNKVIGSIATSYPDDSNVHSLNELMEEMHRSISLMQTRVEDLKKVSVRQLLRPLSRTLRDLCTSLKKQIRLEVVGENLRIDHVLFDILGKCLIHLIRNSADHGIESPADRAKNGKNASGTIVLKFLESPEEITVTISDDGAGIQAERVKKKCIEKGLLTAKQASEKSDAEIRMMIFEPGFSTSEKVTDVSGRGVGTDMVKKVISEYGGKIKLHSEDGKGTEFTLVLPIPKSVLIVNSLLVRSHGETYAIPQDAIDQILAISPALHGQSIKKIGDMSFYDSGNSLNPIIDLDLLLKTIDQPRPLDDGFLIRVAGQGYSYCLRVDDVIGAEDTVVRPISRWLNNLKIYKGGTFLGDGKVGLILDVEGIHKLLDAVEVRGAERVEEDQSTADNRHYLLFSADGQSKWAIPQEEIFRIEKFARSELTPSGSDSYVVYRNQPLLLVNLSSFLPAKTQEINPPSDKMVDVIIVRTGTKLVGCIVHQVDDFVTTPPLGEPTFYAQGYPVHIINETTITLFSAAALERRAS